MMLKGPLAVGTVLPLMAGGPGLAQEAACLRADGGGASSGRYTIHLGAVDAADQGHQTELILRY